MFGAGRIGSYISQGVYTVSAPFHPFGGAVDIIVVEQEDGSYKSTPWYVRFGKFQGVLKATEKVVRINVNEADADFHMYLDDQGEAFFLEEVNAVEKEGESAVSYPSSGDEMEFKQKTMSCDIDKTIMVSEIEGSSKKSLTRNNSRRGEIFGLPIGRRSMKKNGLQSVEPHVEIDSANSLERAEIAADLLELRWSTNLCSGKSVNNVISDVKVDVVEPEFSYDKVDTHLSCSTNSDNSMEFIPGETCIESNIISVRSNVSQRVDNGCIKNDQNALSGFSKASHKADNENILGHASANEASFPKEYGTTESIAKCSGGEETLWTTSDVIVVDETGNSRCSIGEGINTDIVIKKKAVNGLPSENPPANESCETLTSMVHEMGSGELSAGANYLNSLPFVSENDCSVSNLRRPSLPSSAHHCIGNAMLEKTNSLTASYISNKDQFGFSDIDDPKVEKAEHIRTSPSDCGGYSCLGSLESSETAVFNTIIPDDTRQLTSKPTQVNSLANNPSYKFTLNRVSKPINISKALKDVDEEAMVPVAESLPNMQFDSNDLSVNVSQALGRFLDSTLEGFRKVSNEIPITSQISGVQQQVVFSQLTTDSTRISEVTQKNIADPPVEVSLCRHLLYEGMGYEAAACAFAAEKLIIDNILSLGPNNVEFDKLVVRVGGHYFPWDATMPISSAICSPGKEQILEPKNMIVVDRVDDYASEGVAQKSVNSQNGSWKLWPFSFKRSNSMKSRSSRFVASTESPEEIRRNGGAIVPRVAKTKLRTKVPSSEQLASLNLKEGKNVVKFTLSTAMLREQQVDARIFLWKRNAQIVISDVDGTITKSDVLGQFMPWMGMDWSQSGVTHLFSAIKENGYQLLFLSARSISQAYHTRQFLITLKQDGKALPEGPVLISPDGLFPSLYREVIRRAPHEFKIACLQDVKALFSPDQNPFYAGFGNRDTDELSYLKMGIPKGKIFTINPKGQVVVNRRVDSKSYTSLHTLVPDMFPPTNLHEQEDYNSWNFWRLPPPDGII